MSEQLPPKLIAIYEKALEISQDTNARPKYRLAALNIVRAMETELELDMPKRDSRERSKFSGSSS